MAAILWELALFLEGMNSLKLDIKKMVKLQFLSHPLKFCFVIIKQFKTINSYKFSKFSISASYKIRFFQIFQVSYVVWVENVLYVNFAQSFLL